MKRVCISLAAALALAVPSFAQSAEETPFAELVVTYRNVVESTARYTTPAELSAAIDATTSSKDLTITLLRDYTVEAPLVIKNSTIQDVTLDLAGYTLSAAVETDDGAGNVRYLNPIETNVRLVIKDSSEAQTGTVRGRAIENTATLTIEGGTFIECDSGTGSQSGAAIYNTKTLVVNGGVFKTEYAGSSADAGGPACVRNVGDKAKLTVTGGSFESVSQRTYAIISSGKVEISPADGKTVTVTGPRALAIDSGTAVINGGTFTATGWYGLYVSNDGLGEDPMVAAVTINGGTFQGKEYAVWVGSDHNNPVNSTVYINDGTFVNALNRQEVAREDAIVAQGGTYAADPTTYGVVVAPGFKLESKEDGKFAIVEGPAFAIGDTLYETLNEAFAALVPAEGTTFAEGEVPTITLLRDAASAEQAVVPEGANGAFDLNGFTYTYFAFSSYTSAINAHRGQASDPAIMLTITDSSAAQTGTIVAQGNADGCIASTNANLTITGGRFIQEGNSGYAIAGTDGLVIAPADGRTVELPSGGLNLRTGAWTAIKNEGITIAGGTFVAGNEPAYALYTGNGNGPTKLSISGGTFEGGTNGHVAYFATKTNVDITGGDFTDGDLYINAPDSTTVTVSGGDFRDDPRDYGAVLPPDYSVVGDGNSVTAQPDAGATYFAQIGAVKYTDMLVAFKALKNGDTIKLLADYVGTKRLEAKAFGVTVDLNGHTIDGGLYFHPLYSTEYCDNPNCAVIDTSDKPGTIKGKLPLEAGSGNSQNTFAVSVQEGIVLEVAEGGDASVSLKLGSGTRVLAEDRYIAWLGTANPLFKATDADNQAWIFPTFGAAVPFAADGVATLCADYSGNAELTLVGKTLTLDLGGHTYERIVSAGSSDNSIVDCTTSNTHLTIRNGTLKGNGYGVLYVPPSGKTISNLSLTMEDVTLASTFEATAGVGAGLMANGTMENVDFTLRRCKILLGAFAAEADGVQTQVVTDPNANICAIYFPPRGDSTLIIEDTIIKSPYGVQVCAGDLFVKGNTQITTTAANVASTKTGDGPIPDGAAISIVDRAGYGDDATTGSSIGTVTIKGTPTLIAQGEGASAVAAYTWNDNTQSDWAEASEHVAISGGTFSQKPDTDLLDPDFVLVENQDGTFGVASAYVASIGDVKYADFNSFFTAFQAIAASETPTTVTLLADLTGDRAVPGVVPVLAGRNIVFDLNGHTMETALQQGSSTKHYYAIENSGTLTIKDSSAAQTGTIRARGVENLGNGKLTIESGTIVAVDANGGACIWNEADVTVTGGTFKTEFVGTSSDNTGPACLNNSGTALVTGGTFHNVNRRTYAIISNTGSIEITPAEGSEVKVFGAHGGLGVDGGTAVVNGGTYSSSDFYGLYVSNDGLGADPMQAAVTVNGGTFDGKSYSVWVGSDYNDPVNSTIAIKGGTFLKPLHRQDVSRPDAIQVSGGTFSEKPDNAWFADGFIPVENEDGTFGVAPGSFSAEIAGVKYLTLQEAVAAGNGKTIKLLTDATDVGNLNAQDGTRLTIDLNGHNITFAASRYFQVMGGSLHLTGKGRVEESVPNWGAIMVWGAKEDVADYSTVVVDEDVTLEGWAPLFINNNAGCAYGVKVTMAGTAKSVKDIAGAGGHGVYINGSIQKIEGNVPQITLTETSKVTSLGNGIYAAGYAHWTLAGDVSGADALSIKSGTFTITGGDYRGTGSFADPAEAHGNGSENTGAAVTITTNDGYAQAPIVMDISGTPTFTSENGYAFYEGIAKKADGTPAATASRAVIAIKGGDFTGSKTNEAVTADIAVTTAENKQVVSGGTFSQPVALAYCAPGYIPVFKDGKYTVDGTAVAAVANPDAQGAYLGYGTLDALIKASRNGTEVLIVKSEALGEEVNLLKTATGGDNAASGATAYDVAETLGGTFKVQDGAIVYAYQLGIADLDVSESGISVTVRLEEGDAAVTRTLEGRKVRVVSDKTVLAEADAIFTDGACVLTVPAANLPAGNLELTISVAPAAEAETPAE